MSLPRVIVCLLVLLAVPEPNQALNPKPLTELGGPALSCTQRLQCLGLLRKGPDHI